MTAHKIGEFILFWTTTGLVSVMVVGAMCHILYNIWTNGDWIEKTVSTVLIGLMLLGCILVCL
jgi:hypothetical protein